MIQTPVVLAAEPDDPCLYGHDFRYDYSRGDWFCTECREEK